MFFLQNTGLLEDQDDPQHDIDPQNIGSVSTNHMAEDDDDTDMEDTEVDDNDDDNDDDDHDGDGDDDDDETVGDSNQ